VSKLFGKKKKLVIWVLVVPVLSVLADSLELTLLVHGREGKDEMVFPSGKQYC